MDLFALGFIPFSYWLNTRIGSLKKLYSWSVIELLPQCLVIYLLGEKSSVVGLGIFLFLVYIPFMLCYECGYIANDYSNQILEKGRGQISTHKFGGMSTIKNARWRAWIALRLVILAALLTASFALFDWLWLCWLWIGVTSLVFYSHNSLVGKPKLISFAVLQFAKGLGGLIFLVVMGVDHHIEIVIIAVGCGLLIQSTVNTYFYGLNKELVVNRFIKGLGLNSVALALIFSAIGVTAIYIPCQVLLRADLSKLSSLALICYFPLAMRVVFPAIFEVVSSILRSRSIITHAHTYYSHDSVLRIESYLDLIREGKVKKVYLTDHAEDFSPEDFNALRVEIEGHKQECLLNRVIAGLEYPIYGQHVLALNLREYVAFKGKKSLDLLGSLKCLSDRIVWAHPKICIRRLRSPSYVRSLLTLASACDGVEMFNYKNSVRPKESAIMMCVALLANTCFYSKRLYIGLDSHAVTDLG